MLGKNINRIRKHRRLTLDSCAKISGLSPSCLNDIETGIIKKPTRYILENIAYALAVKTSSLSESNLDIEKIDDFLKIPDEYLSTYKVTLGEKRKFIEYIAIYTEQLQRMNYIQYSPKQILAHVESIKSFYWEAKAMNKRK